MVLTLILILLSEYGFIAYQAVRLRHLLASRAWTCIAAGFVLTALWSVVSVLHQAWNGQIMEVKPTRAIAIIFIVRFTIGGLFMVGFHLLRRDLRAIGRRR